MKLIRTEIRAVKRAAQLSRWKKLEKIGQRTRIAIPWGTFAGMKVQIQTLLIDQVEEDIR